MRRGHIAWLIAFCLLGGAARAQEQEERVQPADVYVKSAKIYLQDKNFAKMEEMLRICLENYPDNYQAHRLMGTLWADKDEVDSMMAHFNLARKYAGIKLDKRDQKSMDDIEQSKWLTSFNNGVSYITLADSLDEAANNAPEPAIQYKKSGEVQYGDSTASKYKEQGTISQVPSEKDISSAQKDRERAAQALVLAGNAFRNCTIIRPTEFRGWFNYGMVFDRQRDYSKTAEIYRQGEDLFNRYQLEDSTTNFYDTTKFYQGAGLITPLFEELIKKFKKMKEDQRSRYKGLLTALGSVYFELGQFENCIIVFRRLLGFFEEDLGALEYIGNAYQQLDNQDEALAWTNRILTKNPDDKDRLYNVGVHWYNDGVDARKKYEGMIKEKLQGSKDSNIDVEVTKADERFRRSFTRALEFLDGVLKLDPNDKDSWKLKGVTLFFLERTDEAIPVLEKVRQMLPDESKAICQYLRECYRVKGDADKVLKLTEECGL